MEKVDLRAARQKHPAWSSSWARPRREVGLGTLFTITSELQSGVSTCLAQLTNCSLCSLHRHRHSPELLAHRASSVGTTQRTTFGPWALHGQLIDSWKDNSIHAHANQYLQASEASHGRNATARIVSLLLITSFGASSSIVRSSRHLAEWNRQSPLLSPAPSTLRAPYPAIKVVIQDDPGWLSGCQQRDIHGADRRLGPRFSSTRGLGYTDQIKLKCSVTMDL